MVRKLVFYGIHGSDTGAMGIKLVIRKRVLRPVSIHLANKNCLYYVKKVFITQENRNGYGKPAIPLAQCMELKETSNKSSFSDEKAHFRTTPGLHICSDKIGLKTPLKRTYCNFVLRCAYGKSNFQR